MFERDAFPERSFRRLVATQLSCSRPSASRPFRGLTETVVVGFALGSVLFIHAHVADNDAGDPGAAGGRICARQSGGRRPEWERARQSATVVVYPGAGLLSRPAASHQLAARARRQISPRRDLIIDFSAVPFVDSSRHESGGRRLLAHAGLPQARLISVTLAGI